MQTYKITIQPTSAFGTSLHGDTLFGQFCWGIVHLLGENNLTKLLNGYTNSRPFIVFSDAFPVGYLPLPTLPSHLFNKVNEDDRKLIKKVKWIKVEDCQLPVSELQKKAWEHRNDPILINQYKEQEQNHNTIDRLVGSTTAGGQFAPYLDEERLSLLDTKTVLENIGKFGFGRDASIGLGQFNITSIKKFDYPMSHSPNCYMTLSNAAPQNSLWDKEHCYYQITTRFGRHGDLYALDGNPFKKPIILTKAGSIFKPKVMQELLFIGQGLNRVSFISSEIVHQGYAPVIPLRLDI